MEHDSLKLYNITDASGAVLHTQMLVDGVQLATFRTPPEVTAVVVRNIKNLNIRDNDVMLCTPLKCGTHWCFELLFMLLNGTTEISAVHKIFMMLIKVPEEELDKLQSPRILNTHLPFRMLPVQMKEKKTKIILVLRNPKDVVVSLYHHHRGMAKYNYDGKFSDHLQLFMEGKCEIGDWKKHFTVAENEAFDRLFDAKMKSSKLKFRFEPMTTK